MRSTADYACSTSHNSSHKSPKIAIRFALFRIDRKTNVNHEIAKQFSPFGEADCESEIKLLKQEYSEYFFYETRFNSLALDPNVFLIVGRRGSGKTALSQFFSFQKQLRNTIAIDVDEPVAFEQMLEKISKLTMQSREVAIPRIAKIWDFIIWLIIFRELKDQDIRIRSMLLSITS
jgi:hypothetical protein